MTYFNFLKRFNGLLKTSMFLLITFFIYSGAYASPNGMFINGYCHNQGGNVIQLQDEFYNPQNLTNLDVKFYVYGQFLKMWNADDMVCREDNPNHPLFVGVFAAAKIKGLDTHYRHKYLAFCDKSNLQVIEGNGTFQSSVFVCDKWTKTIIDESTQGVLEFIHLSAIRDYVKRAYSGTNASKYKVPIDSRVDVPDKYTSLVDCAKSQIIDEKKASCAKETLNKLNTVFKCDKMSKIYLSIPSETSASKKLVAQASIDGGYSHANYENGRPIPNKSTNSKYLNCGSQQTYNQPVASSTKEAPTSNPSPALSTTPNSSSSSRIVQPRQSQRSINSFRDQIRKRIELLRGKR